MFVDMRVLRETLLSLLHAKFNSLLPTQLIEPDGAQAHDHIADRGLYDNRDNSRSS